jgi:metal-dependent HD superfamily phosphatase/phosphodiesterase
MNFETIKKDPDVRTYIQKADEALSALGYTEHSLTHATIVARVAGDLLLKLDYGERDVELCRIAGFLHDIGNIVNRSEHSQSGAIIAFRLLDKMGFGAEEIATVVSAIGNHDEGTGVPVNATAAALILADKSDVRRSRVRAVAEECDDIHERVNYSVTKSSLETDIKEKTVALYLTVDPKIASVMEYFEIFMERMLLCRKAAETLGLTFALFINEQKML